MKFAMPFGEELEICPSQDIDETEIGSDEEVDGVHYNILWNGEKLPWFTKTRLQATAIAFGCQWGASQMYKKMQPK